MRIPLAVSCQARRRNLNQAAKVQSEETESRAAILHSALQSEVLITHTDKKEQTTTRAVCSFLVEAAGLEPTVSSTRNWRDTTFATPR